MPTINCSPEEMLEKAKTIRNYASTVFTHQRNIRGKIGGLGQDFFGKLPSKLVQSMLSMDKKYQDMYDNLVGYADFLEQTVNAYRDTDMFIKSVIAASVVGGAAGGASAPIVTEGPASASDKPPIVTTGPAQNQPKPFPTKDSPKSANYHGHTGIDFPTPLGTSVTSVVSGTVVDIVNVYPNDYNTHNGTGIDPNIEKYNKDYGNRVVILGDDGKYYWYAHLQNDGPALKKGQRIEAGDWIGNSGNTGNSTGPHLHFEVRNTNIYGDHIPVGEQKNYL